MRYHLQFEFNYSQIIIASTSTYPQKAFNICFNIIIISRVVCGILLYFKYQTVLMLVKIDAL